MSFARRNVLLPRGIRVVPAVIIAFAIAIFLIRLFAPNFFITLAKPFWGVSSYTAGVVGTVSAAFKNPVTLARDLDAARTENAALVSQNTTLAGQVNDLQKLLGSRTAAPAGVLAAVLARPPESAYDTLVVDQGTAAGVLVDALVTGPGGAPLGRIASVTATNARVTLFSASDIKTEGWVGENRVPLTLLGAGGGTFDASVPRDAKVIVGDAVYVGGGLSIGKIIRADSDPSSPTATLRIQSAINPFTLLWVTIAL